MLSGARRSSFTDGLAGGVRDIPGGGAVDLTASTNMLNCGKATNCTAAQMNANSRERPWGANNPRWQLYAFGPMEQFTQFARPAPCYLAVWVADDGREEDGDPLADAVEDGESGHGIVRVHAEAFGLAGSRRAIEAELVRACRGGGAAPACRAFVCNRGRNCASRFLDLHAEKRTIDYTPFCGESKHPIRRTP